jgi:hypothetical protein
MNRMGQIPIGMPGDMSQGHITWDLGSALTGNR